MSSPLPPPAGRYGAPASRRRRLAGWVALGVLGAAGVAVTVWLGLASAHHDVSSGVRAFRTGPSSVTVTFEVQKAAGRAAVCEVRALGIDGAEVGRAEVPVPARTDGARTTVLTYTLHTSSRPVTGEVQNCRLAG